MREIQSPAVFWTAAVAVVAYLLYIMIRKPKRERHGRLDREPEL
jgi:hypothetical protein